MKKFLSNEYNVLTARVFLGVLMIVVSVDKISDPLAFTGSISDYRLVSGTAATLLATVIPWIELFCGLALLAGVLVQGSALAVGIMLSFFTVAVISALVRGLDISCGCFTQDPSAAKIGWLKIGENIVLVAVAVFLYFSENLRFSLDQYIRDRNPGS